MQRRDILRAFAGAGLAVGAGTQSWADVSSVPATEPWQRDFEAARAGAPWTLGYVGLNEDAAPLALRVEGRIPDGLQGDFFRNGPARHALGGMRYHHFFDGDGLMQQYRVRGQAVTHRARFVRTDKFLADSAAGHPVREAFGTRWPGMEPVTSADRINVANTSVLQHAGELLALWEGGSATRLDPRTLDTLGLKTWSDEYAGMPFSAHPKVDPQGHLWNFGVSSMQGMLSVYHIGPDGALREAVTLPVPQIAMVHDFAVTERHLVFLLPPLVFDRARAEAGHTFLDSHVWTPDLGLRVLVLDKNDLRRQQWFGLPAGFVFHVGNAWEDDGHIHLDYARSATGWNARTGFVELMRGHYDPPEFSTLATLDLDLRSGRARQDLLDPVVEFPRIDPRFVSQRHTQLYTAARLALPHDRPGFDAVVRTDMDSGRQDAFRYGEDMMVEEHLFVPRPGSNAEGDGWLLGTALDLKHQQMVWSVFDGRSLAAGPIAQARMDRVMPLGLHGAFVPPQAQG